MQKNCRQCAQSFEITEIDLEFYKKISPVFQGKTYEIPAPTLCPDCRQQRRLVFRNERKLYKRNCNATGQPIISIYAPESGYIVYNSDYWWSDKWDPMNYGQEFDFKRGFFEQFYELQLAVPRVNLFSKGGENSVYTNHAPYNKNCYMLFNATKCQDVHYSTNYVIDCRNCVDCYSISHSELLYDCFLLEHCYQSINLVNCKNCTDSAFLYDCRSCRHCFMSWGLRNKEYYIQNKPYSREDYEKFLRRFDLGSYKIYRDLKDKFLQMYKMIAIHRALIVDQSEECTGDYIFQSKNTHDSFYAIQCQDSRYLYDSFGHTDSYDSHEGAFECEQQYECSACNFNKFSKFSNLCHESHNINYSNYCFNSHDLFGCIGLRRKEYCILNKQYTKEEYEELVPKIIEHMSKVLCQPSNPLLFPPSSILRAGLSTGGTIPAPNRVPFGSTSEWGEFFPISLSPFAYNESVAMDFCPMSKEAVLKMGGRWRDEEERPVAADGSITPTDHINEVRDEIINRILTCETCGRHYRLIAQEVAFYRSMPVAAPRQCFECRHKARLYFRNPRQLFDRNCLKCGQAIKTTYAPDRCEKVYCEKCYLEAVY